MSTVPAVDPATAADVRHTAAVGWHFLQIPGPTNLPEAVKEALGRQTIDHRSAEFATLAKRVLTKLPQLVGTQGPVALYPSSGTGAWEAALVNVLSPNDRVLMAETGQFSHLWRDLATRLGLDVTLLPGDWRSAVDATAVEAALRSDRERRIRAVAVVHNETSTGVLSGVRSVRDAIDAADHPALLLVDTISSLGSADYRHDEWGVDVTIGCSQKGLMSPPGVGFNAIGPKALAAAQHSRFPKAYWDWTPMIEASRTGLFPYTPPTNLLYALDAALDLLLDEGLDSVFARHLRLAAACRAAVGAWGLELQCRRPEEYSPSLTAVRLPPGIDEAYVRRVALEQTNTALGAGLGPLRGVLFRIGHLGWFNEPMLLGTLGSVELALRDVDCPLQRSGVAAAVDWLARHSAYERAE